MIHFDKEAPGGGVDAYTVWNNQKAEIYFTVYLEEDGIRPAQDRVRLELWMRTAEGEEAAYMSVRTSCPEDGRRSWAITARTLLIQPHLWQGRQSPYLYDVEVRLVEEKPSRKETNQNEEIRKETAGSEASGEVSEQMLCLKYPICSMRYRGEGNFLLNSRPYPLHAVRYAPGADAAAVLSRDLEQLKQLGANCLCPEHFPADPRFYEVCLEHGLLLWKMAAEQPQAGQKLPLFCAEEKKVRAAGAQSHSRSGSDHLIPAENVLLEADRRHKLDAFYYYQALWSDKRVLHICRLPKTRQSGGTVTVTVYSNQKKVALYVNGYLREFKESAPCFVFEDVELAGEETVLSARSEECFTSYTVSG